MYIPRDGCENDLYNNDYYNEWYHSISSREEYSYDNGDYSYDSSQAQFPTSDKESNHSTSFHNISSDGGDDNQKWAVLGPKVTHIYRNDIKVKQYRCTCEKQKKQQQEEKRSEERRTRKFCIPALCSVCSKSENEKEKEKKVVVVKRSGFLNELCHRKCAVVRAIRAQMRSLPTRMANHPITYAGRWGLNPKNWKVTFMALAGLLPFLLWFALVCGAYSGAALCGGKNLRVINPRAVY